MSDAALEAAIDRVGRDKVFARAREVGWKSGDTPPKWVWWTIVAEFDVGPDSLSAPPSKKEGKG